MGKRRTILHYATGAVALLAAVLAVSCGDGHEAEAVPQEPTPLRVGFRIALGEANVARAAEADGDDADTDTDAGVDFESFIDVEHKNYRILFFDTQNRYLTSFRPQDFSVGESESGVQVYDLIGRIDKRLPRDFKVVVLANWPAYPESLVEGKTTIEQVCTGDRSRYDYTPPFVCSGSTPIPMYGVRQYAGVEFRSQTITFLGTIHLLRAMAKAEVVCKTKGWTLDKVVLYRYNRAGYCAPSGIYDEKDYSGSDYVGAVHVPDGAVEKDSLAFEKLKDGRFVIYLPEHRNVEAGAKRADAAEIKVFFEERADKEYTVEFKYYQNPPVGSALGDPFDVRRNNYYKFTVSKSEEFAEPRITVDVYPYDRYELYPGFGEEKKDDETGK